MRACMRMFVYTPSPPVLWVSTNASTPAHKLEGFEHELLADFAPIINVHVAVFVTPAHVLMALLSDHGAECDWIDCIESLVATIKQDIIGCCNRDRRKSNVTRYKEHVGLVRVDGSKGSG